MEAARTWWVGRTPQGRLALEVTGLLAVPLLLECVLLGIAWRDGILGVDLEQTLLPSAEFIRDGVSPFARAHYPPLIPVLLVPFTFVPSAEAVICLLAAAAVPGTLWALDIRDWRCYGAAFLWPPVFSGIQTGNATLFLVLAAALAWRYRENAAATAVAAGLSIGAKLLTWPLAAWLAATGRVRAAAGALAIGVLTTVGLGALLQLALESGDVERFGDLATSESTPSYSVVDISHSLGAPTVVGLTALGVVALALVAVSVVLGRRGDDTGSFSVACLACLAGAPNVWLHSFAFFLPIVALLRPRFSGAWLAPVLFVLVPVGDPSAAEVAYAWLFAAAFALWLLGPRARSRATNVRRRQSLPSRYPAS